jgi:SpoIID/LytB domain protein
MSQWGAYEGAALGKSYSDILQFYYQGATLSTMSNPAQDITVRLTYSPTSGPPSNAIAFYQVVLTAVGSSVTFSSSAASQTLPAGTSSTIIWSGGKAFIAGWAQPLDYVQMSPTSSAGRVRIQITATNGAAQQAYREYWGRIRLDPDSTGLEVRNTLSMDKYVGDINEVPASWPAEAVKTQAVAARSYALAQTGTMYDDTRSQCYRGYISNGAVAEDSRRVSAATATSGKYMSYGGKVLTTYYSADSGGYICNRPWTSVMSPPFVAKADPWSAAAPSPNKSWSYTITQQAMNNALSGLGVGSVVSLSVASRDTADPNSHARTITVVGTTKTVTIDVSALRSYLGSSNLKSSLIINMYKDGTLNTYEQTDSRLAFAGSWATTSTTSASGGSFVYANTSGSKVTIKFNGTYLAWIAKKSNQYGYAKVTLDGTPVTVDLYSPVELWKQNVWNTGTLVSGAHTVTIEWTGGKNGAAAATNIGIDAVQIVGTLTDASSPVITRYEQSDSRLAYTGTWTTWPTASTSGGSCKYSNLLQAAVNVKFTGTYLSWIGIKGPLYGKAKVTVDGGTAQVIDLYSPTSVFKSSVWNTGTLTSGTHTVRIEWTGTKNASAIGTYVGIDAFDVVGTLAQATATASGPTPTRYEQSDSHIAYTGTWTTWNTGYVSGSSCKYSNLTGAAVNLQFTGTYLSWVGIKGPLYGKAKVTVDSGTPEVIDLYSPTSVFKSSVWNTGTLTSGTHTVRIEWTGTKNASATNTYIGMDAFDVAGTLG